MSEQNQAPGSTDADDTVGHVNYRGAGDQPKVDDAEGHLFRRGDDGDDTRATRGPAGTMTATTSRATAGVSDSPC